MKIKAGTNWDIEYCCQDASEAPGEFYVFLNEDRKIVATLRDQEDMYNTGEPFRFCPWCGVPINEEKETPTQEPIAAKQNPLRGEWTTEHFETIHAMTDKAIPPKED